MDRDLRLLQPQRRRRRWPAVVATVVVGAAVAATAGVSAGSASTSAYRTATAGEHSVEQSLTGVATIEPVSQASVAFPAAGTVSSVAVKVGDKIDAGAELASLDPTSLQATLSQAQADLDQARLTLERAQNGESTVSSGSVRPASLTTSDSEEISIQLITASAPADDLGTFQQQVLDAQRQVDLDLAASDQALASAKAACAALPAATRTTEPTSGETSPSVTSCYQALSAALDAQKKVDASQKALQVAATALDTLLAQRAVASAAQPQPQPQPQPSSPGGTGGEATGDARTSPEQSEPSQQGPITGGAATTSPSSADLIAYQKAVDAAGAQVAVAEQAVRQGTMVTPIAGTVVAVNLKAGDTVTAGSTTSTVVVTGGGGYEAVTMVKVTDLPDLEVGQAATVTPDGSASGIAGRIANIGLVSTSGTTGTTYPLTIALMGDPSELRIGSVGSVTITTAASSRAVAVPTSAVHADNGRYTVTALEAGKTKDVSVEVGAIGAAWTEIKSGLVSGQTVVLADINEPLPGSATSTSGQTQFGPFSGRDPAGLQRSRN